jgi:hypothetical protein
MKSRCPLIEDMGLSLWGKTKPFSLWGRNAPENIAQRRSWFCPAIERALGLLPSIALSSHPTDLIVGSGRRKSIGLGLKNGLSAIHLKFADFLSRQWGVP